MKALLSALGLGACICSAIPAAAQTVNITDDPAAMQRAIPSEDVSVPTILTLFDDGRKSAPQQLTAFDRAYLCGLYDVPSVAMPAILASRLNQNVRQAYDSNCANAMPAAALAHASAP